MDRTPFLASGSNPQQSSFASTNSMDTATNAKNRKIPEEEVINSNTTSGNNNRSITPRSPRSNYSLQTNGNYSSQTTPRARTGAGTSSLALPPYPDYWPESISTHWLCMITDFLVWTFICLALPPFGYYSDEVSDVTMIPWGGSIPFLNDLKKMFYHYGFETEIFVISLLSECVYAVLNYLFPDTTSISSVLFWTCLVIPFFFFRSPQIKPGISMTCRHFCGKTLNYCWRRRGQSSNSWFSIQGRTSSDTTNPDMIANHHGRTLTQWNYNRYNRNSAFDYFSSSNRLRNIQNLRRTRMEESNSFSNSFQPIPGLDDVDDSSRRNGVRGSKLPISVKRVMVNATESLYIIGTMHISSASARDAWTTCVRKRPNLVMIELDKTRLRGMRSAERRFEARFVFSRNGTSEIGPIIGAVAGSKEKNPPLGGNVDNTGGTKSASADRTTHQKKTVNDEQVYGSGCHASWNYMCTMSPSDILPVIRDTEYPEGNLDSSIQCQGCALVLRRSTKISYLEQTVIAERLGAKMLFVLDFPEAVVPVKPHAASVTFGNVNQSPRTGASQSMASATSALFSMDPSKESNAESGTTTASNPSDREASATAAAISYGGSSTNEITARVQAFSKDRTSMSPAVEGARPAGMSSGSSSMPTSSTSSDYLDLVANGINIPSLISHDSPEYAAGLISAGGLRDRIKLYWKFGTTKLPAIPAFLVQNHVIVGRPDESGTSSTAVSGGPKESGTSGTAGSGGSAENPIFAGQNGPNTGGNPISSPLSSSTGSTFSGTISGSSVRSGTVGGNPIPNGYSINRSSQTPFLSSDCVYTHLRDGGFSTVRLRESYSQKVLPKAVALKQQCIRNFILSASGIGVLYGIMEWCGVEAGLEFQASCDYCDVLNLPVTCVDIDDGSLAVGIKNHLALVNLANWISQSPIGQCFLAFKQCIRLSCRKFLICITFGRYDHSDNEGTIVCGESNVNRVLPLSNIDAMTLRSSGPPTNSNPNSALNSARENAFLNTTNPNGAMNSAPNSAAMNNSAPLRNLSNEEFEEFVEPASRYRALFFRNLALDILQWLSFPLKLWKNIVYYHNGISRNKSNSYPDVIGISLRALISMPIRNWFAFILAVCCATIVVSFFLVGPLVLIIMLARWIAKVIGKLSKTKSIHHTTQTIASYTLLMLQRSNNMNDSVSDSLYNLDLINAATIVLSRVAAGKNAKGTNNLYNNIEDTIDNHIDGLNGVTMDTMDNTSTSVKNTSTSVKIMKNNVETENKVIGGIPGGLLLGVDSNEEWELLTDVIVIGMMVFLLPAVYRGLLMDRDEMMFRSLVRELTNKAPGNAVLVIGAAHMPGICRKIRKRGMNH